MVKRFRCRHCHKLKKVNIRLKGKQSYCGSKACQQARKNSWEKEKISKDPKYIEKRKAAKSEWRRAHRAGQYQKDYRQAHPFYYEQDLEKQKVRNKNRVSRSGYAPVGKIVKTDALTSISLITSGLYEILPYRTGAKEKIVKTGALIVEIKTCQGIWKKELIRTG